MTTRSWIVGLSILICVAGIHCLAQSQAQLACEQAATAGFEACLKNGIPCLPGHLDCGPHKGSYAQCLPAYNFAYARCQPSFSWIPAGGPNPNWPVARASAAYWTDAQGYFWLFGGNGLDTQHNVAAAMNDLWRIPRGGSTWQLLGGSSFQPVASSSSWPGGRYGTAFTLDAKGDVWLFGGQGYGPGETPGLLNDLWEYTPGAGGAVGTWKMIWSSSSGVLNQQGNYGKQNVASSTNAPGGRADSVCWFDSSGNFWLFGGFAIGSAGGKGYFFNDLWMYSPSAGTWTWVNGATIVSGSGTVTTPGMPGGRAGASYWSDGKGNVWIFGGFGFDSKGNHGALNDLWLFNSGSGQWSMVNGSATVAGAVGGNYGQQGTPSGKNEPPGRSQATSWIDSQGNFWLFGGNYSYITWGYSGSSALQDLFNDLWEYKSGSATWIWIGGPQGTGSTAAPGARFGAAGWPEYFPKSWLFGGYGVDSPSWILAPYLDDFWEGTGTVY